MGLNGNGKVKVGIIGVGKMGTYHANVLSALNKNVEFVGVYDINRQRSELIARRYNIKYFETMDDILKNVDAVCIAVPTKYHFEVAKKTLEADKHTLLEKPIARTVEEARELVRIADERGLIFQVGHVERFKGAVTELRKIVNNPYLIEARRLSPWINKDWDTGVVLDLMIHDIDIVLSLIKSNVVHIDAVGKRVKSLYEDVASALLQFENGAIASITSSRLSETRIRAMAISQDKAFIYLNFETQDINIYRGASASFFVSKKEITYKHETIVERVLVQKENALKEELVHFIECIKGETKPIITGEDDVKTLSVTIDIIKSINKKMARERVG